MIPAPSPLRERAGVRANENADLQRREWMKKVRYTKPKVVGGSAVHPC
jgi:hypothetical protein